MMNPSPFRRLVRVITLAGFAAGALACGARSADAAAITLGTASSYGLLVGTSETLTLNGGLALSGNVGVSSGDTVTLAGNNAVSGTAYEDSNVTTNYSGNTSVSGGIVTQSMSSIVSAAATASTNAGKLTGTSGMVDQNSSISLSGSSLTIKAVQNASENVLNISALSLTNGTLTFDDNGYTNAKFIINVTGAFSVGAGAVIKGINGASGADIIFNIENTGTAVSLTGNSSTSIIGTILAPQRSVTLGGGGSLTGALIAGVNNAGKSYTVSEASSGYNITSLGYVPYSASSSKVPEPSSIALLGAGMSALIAARRRRNR